MDLETGRQQSGRQGEAGKLNSTIEISSDSEVDERCQLENFSGNVIVLSDEEETKETVSLETKETVETKETKETRETNEKPKPKFVCQFCKITFTNILSWKSHENAHRDSLHHSSLLTNLSSFREMK